MTSKTSILRVICCCEYVYLPGGNVSCARKYTNPPASHSPSTTGTPSRLVPSIATLATAADSRQTGQQLSQVDPGPFPLYHPRCIKPVMLETHKNKKSRSLENPYQVRNKNPLSFSLWRSSDPPAAWPKATSHGRLARADHDLGKRCAMWRSDAVCRCL